MCARLYERMEYRATIYRSLTTQYTMYGMACNMRAHTHAHMFRRLTIYQFSGKILRCLKMIGSGHVRFHGERSTVRVRRMCVPHIIIYVESGRKPVSVCKGVREKGAPE